MALWNNDLVIGMKTTKGATRSKWEKEVERVMWSRAI